jgi:hypothetical protein
MTIKTQTGTRRHRGSLDAGSFFCQVTELPAIDRIDLPNPAELRQETVLRILQNGSDETSCEDLMRAHAGLARRVFGLARADFFRNRYGRPPQIVLNVDQPGLEEELIAAGPPHELPVTLELALLNRVETLGEPLVRDIVRTMLAAQRARKRGRMPDHLKQRIYRLRIRSGLPLRTELL